MIKVDSSNRNIAAFKQKMQQLRDVQMSAFKQKGVKGSVRRGVCRTKREVAVHKGAIAIEDAQRRLTEEEKKETRHEEAVQNGVAAIIEAQQRLTHKKNY